jgi:cell division protein FtsB
LADKNKTQLLIGVFLVIAAFIGVAVAFYFVIGGQRDSAVHIEELKKQIEVLQTEKDLIAREVKTLQDAWGTSLSLQNVLLEASRQYGDMEKNRREGSLWIDRKTASYIVTLGALNGLIPGSRLKIYDGQEEVGNATVDVPLDIISYVTPVDKKLAHFPQDYYRVVIEP